MDITQDWAESLRDSGFTLVRGMIPDSDLSLLAKAAEEALQSPVARARQGSGYGLRGILDLVPAARAVAHSPQMMGVVTSILGPAARPVKAILFDKTEQANWAVPWHQDVTIAVRKRIDAPGFEAWSEKDGVPHVQPPVDVLEQMLAVRIHLDPCPATNGALRVIPGSHAHGRLTDEQIDAWCQCEVVTCEATVGDALLMRPLLLHSSRRATSPRHRRVLHIEYAAHTLPYGLDWND